MSRQNFPGQLASPGTALGVLHRIDAPPAEIRPRRADSGAPDTVAESFDAVAGQLQELALSLRASGQSDLADIVEANSYIALDKELRGAAVRRIGEGDSVTHAVSHAVHEYADMLAALEDATLAERAADVRQVGRRVLAYLSGSGAAAPDGPLVLVAHEVGAADLLEHGETVVAAASVIGGPNSHASIIARSLGIPLILGIDPAVLEHPDGTEALIDAEYSSITLYPDDDERGTALTTMDAARRRREILATERDLPSRSLDGVDIGLRANIATPVEAKAANAANAGGVGLLRTELPFLDARGWPTENQHAAVLRPILGKLAGQPVTVRTLDFADDKFPPFLADQAVDGHLGRGLPHMLADPKAFAHQFRAILTAGEACDLRVMIPMVADVGELAACKEILAAAADDLGFAPPPIGAMIELPEAVAAADELAREAAFFSIGSNDLTSQILGLDRRDPAVTPALAAHPRILAAVARTVQAAHRRGIPVSVCGDAAAHPLVIPLLIGLGCDVLSVAPAALDEVRVRIRRLDARACADAAAQALDCDRLDHVHQIVRRQCWPSMP
ncbi:phosphoenolpyruvate-protein kinase (PTS system EI component) [Catenulispora sp. MAP5-51]|uniref:putative PEP-binding protein n=1 Tax=Catenulispora sp. MAP5-51 TaxID=3156298 RepID=UPI0035135A67